MEILVNTAFDNKLHKFEEIEIALSDAILAWRLLKSFNLSEIHFQFLYPPHKKWPFNSMRDILKALKAGTKKSVYEEVDNTN